MKRSEVHSVPVDELFCKLVRIPSPSQHEGAVAHFICSQLSACGIPFVIDGSASATGSETGNVVARLWRSDECPTVLLLAHMDTVQAVGDIIEPLVGDDGLITSRGETVLGADNKSAVAALLHVLAHGSAEHANVLAVFSTCEERGTMGVTELASLVNGVDLAFAIDGSRPIGTVFDAALGQTPFELLITGRPAHAASAPEKGVHALRVACEIVSGLQLGNCGDTVMNVSEIKGGTETNIIPGFVEIRGEVRAYAGELLKQRLDDVEAFARDTATRLGATVEMVRRPQDGTPPFMSPPNGACALVAEAAAQDIGLRLVTERSRATLEANHLAALGIPTLGVASGGRNPHSTDESISVGEIESLSRFIDALLRACRHSNRTF
jgi:tripeptide aminopeptidase